MGYPDCFDHITNHGVDGLKSKVTFASSDTVQCLGLGVTFSGVLSVGADVKNYKLLSSNPLGSRTVLLQRSSPGSGTWSTYRTLTTNSITGAYATSVGFSTSTTWDWRVTYAGEVAIDPRTGATIRVTWTTGC